ncbi:hypothetical protein [Komagataeibacter saccharivorans]|nr:hypothetical protein [Komagataeibacter saccharivorans]
MKAWRCSRFALAVQKRFLEHFMAGTPALSIAEVIGVNHNIASLFYHENREIIAEHNAHEALLEVEVEVEVEVDESFFVQTSQRQKRPGDAGKVAVFRPLRRGGRIHAIMLSDCWNRDVYGHSKENTADSIVYSDACMLIECLMPRNSAMKESTTQMLQ